MGSHSRTMMRRIEPFRRFEDKEERMVSLKGNKDKTKRLAKEKRRAHNDMAWDAKAKDRQARKIKKRQRKKQTAKGIKRG